MGKVLQFPKRFNEIASPWGITKEVLHEVATVTHERTGDVAKLPDYFETINQSRKMSVADKEEAKTLMVRGVAPHLSNAEIQRYIQECG